MTRRGFCGSLVAGTVSAATCHTQLLGQEMSGKDRGNGLAKPTPQQFAWQDLELGLFIHFDMATFTGQMKPRKPADPNIYNPVKLDTDQWLEAAKAMDAKYAVFVAKHCTGFLSWQSNAYPYGVKQTSWRGATALLLLRCCPQRPNWPPPDWRILVGDGLLGSPIRAPPHQRVIFGPISKKFGNSWERAGKLPCNPRDPCYP